jgi:RNA polymerase sigma-B factor
MDDMPRAERTALLLRTAASASSATERARCEERVIEVNMPVAAQIAARYRGRGVPQEDLEQVAYLALVKSVHRYEYAEDRDFLSFAVPTIRGEVQRHFRDLGWTIRPTRTIQTAQARIRSGEGELWQLLGRAPRPTEIAEHLGLDLDVVIEALAANGCFTPASLHTPAADGGTPIGDLLPDHEDEDAFDRVETRLVLGPLLAGCSDRERRMLEMRFFQHLTQQEIGDTLGLSQMQVSRLLSSLMTRLRDELLSQGPGGHAAESVA